jgi:hypothetical protein
MLKQSLHLLIVISFAFFANLLWAAKAVDYTPPDFIPDQVVSDDKIIYLLSKSNKAIYRWSIATSAYLSPLTVGLVKDDVEYLPTIIEVAPGHSRLYVGYATGDIRYLALSGTATERNFATTAMPIKELAAAGKYLIVVDGTSDYVGNRYSFNNRGSILYQDSSQYDLRYQYRWSPVDSKLYLSDDKFVAYTTVDQKNGKFGTGSFLFYSHGYYALDPIFSISADGRYLLANDGAIVDASKRDLRLADIGSELTAGKFLPDGRIVSLSRNYYWPSRTILEMRDANLRVVEQREYAGEALNIYGTASKYAVLLVNNNKLEILSYVPNPDSDGDGVANTSDAFPLDAAASRDADKDGYPDAWNKNQNASSSPTGLVLDAYPKDAECNSLAQGDGKLCNYAATTPVFTPDAVTSDAKTVYLLSIYNKKIYRWSIEKGTYISPLKPGITSGYQELFPTTMAFAEDQNRLYLGYASGAVNYVQPSASSTAVEKPFASVDAAVSKLVPAGKMLVIQSQISRYSFDSKAIQKDKKQQYPDSVKYTWDKVNSRLYFLSSSYTNYQFYYFLVNQTSGKLSEYKSSAFNINNSLGNLLTLSPDARQILLGNGDIFKAEDLSLSRSLGRRSDAAKWLADGSIVQVYPLGQKIVLSRINQSNQLLETTSFDGDSLVGLFGTDKAMVVLAFRFGKLVSYAYTPKDDIDGDKVPNAQDAFPNDPAASVDSDNDGYPDSWNRGYNQSKSTSGLVLDAYPKDSACALISDGDGTICDYAARVPAFIPDQIINEGDIVYLLSKANNRIYRWSITAGNYINPLVVGTKEGTNTLAPTSFAIVADHQRVYLGYANGQINYINLDGAKENSFAIKIEGQQQLVAAGKYLLVNSAYPYSSSGQLGIYDKSGTSTVNGDSFYTSNTFGWDAVNSTVYLFRDNTSPNDLLFRVIDQATGKVTASGESPYHGDYLIKAPIRPSADGSLILLGSGDLYEQEQLKWVGSLGAQIDDARWLADNSLVTIKNHNNLIKLQRRDTTLKVVEETSFAGIGLGIFGSDSKMVVLALDDEGKVQAHVYTPSNDTDADGVNNTADAFPMDPAASVDTDNDGYPDSWNTGKDAVDSTSGLTLDAYPVDSACYLSEHGDGTNCDYAATMPDFIPDQIASDGEVIYYLSKSNGRIYRWSIADEKFINPWIVGVTQGFIRVAPRKMALSQAHGRMYLGYETGQVRYISLSGAKENEFTAVAMSVDGLAAAGDHLLVQDNSGAWETHYIFDAAGALTDSKDWNYYSHEYAWDSANSKIYFFRDDTSPNDLHFEVIDPVSGKITQEGETPYHGAYNTSGVIRVSGDGTRVLLGSGDIYNGTDLTWATSVGAMVDARWLADSSLVTVKNTGNQFVVERRDASLRLVEQRIFAGEVLGIFGSDAEMTLSAFIDGKLGAYTYMPSDDSDNDGIENTVDAFPLDPAASVDTDNDGYPDAWNVGYTQADSTSNLNLDAYPQDSACYLPAHGNGTDCDYGATIPNYVPDQIASDAEYIYLLSSTNQRIYRWSLADKKYVNPLVIGYKQDLAISLPEEMALSEGQRRIYLGYRSGAIRYLDLQTGRELPFANIPNDNFANLASVGNYLLVERYRIAWAEQYIFDENGSITDRKNFNPPSSEYTWSPVDSRVYYSGLWATVDQETGKITNQGSLPYAYGYDQLGARVSPDGALVLIGNGAIYSSIDFSLQKDLSSSLSDALWTGFALTTLEYNQLKVRSPIDFSELQSHPVTGTALRIVADGQYAVVVHVVNGAVQFSRFAIGDNDGDGLPKWWEESTGLNDDYAGDAALDSDGDTLTNLEEYQAKTNPNVVDTDGDGISDGDEVKVYLSSPIKTDSDGDGLNDYVELFDHQTDPFNPDTDNDSYSDYAEISVYATDPKNAASVPPAITTMQESFEAETLSPLWVAGTNSNANWTVDSSSAFAGANSIRSGAINHNQRSSIVFKGLFAVGTLSFHARVDAEGCCDKLQLYVDGEWRLDVSAYSAPWAQYSVPLTSGNHEIEWRYSKDGSVVTGADAAWIDKVEFIAN